MRNPRGEWVGGKYIKIDVCRVTPGRTTHGRAVSRTGKGGV